MKALNRGCSRHGQIGKSSTHHVTCCSTRPERGLCQAGDETAGHTPPPPATQRVGLTGGLPRGGRGRMEVSPPAFMDIRWAVAPHLGRHSGLPRMACTSRTARISCTHGEATDHPAGGRGHSTGLRRSGLATADDPHGASRGDDDGSGQHAGNTVTSGARNNCAPGAASFDDAHRPCASGLRPEAGRVSPPEGQRAGEVLGDCLRGVQPAPEVTGA